jgi:hypothetical protein
MIPSKINCKKGYEKKKHCRTLISEKKIKQKKNQPPLAFQTHESSHQTRSTIHEK